MCGENEAYHGFGVELGHASEPDEPVKVWTLRQIMRISSHGMSFPGTIIRESILQWDDYCNDLIDNVIMDCEQFLSRTSAITLTVQWGNNTKWEP